MERSKGIILIVVGLAAVLIVWKVGFTPVEKTETASTSKSTNKQPAENTNGQPAVSNTAQSETQHPTEADAAQNMNPRQQRDRNQGGFQQDNRNNANVSETTMKISIPKEISEADLLVLAQEYNEILNMNRFSRGRTGRGGGGMMGGGFGGGGFGGGPGGGFGGGPGGGFGG